MITISVALKASMASSHQTICQIVKIVLADTTVKAFARHSKDITFSGDTYLATNVDNFSDIASACDLSVDNGELSGVLTSPSITEASLHGGDWDYADFTLSLINWADTTQGALVLRSGKIGKVSARRNQFTAEHRSKLQAYSAVLGELTQPGCRAEFGDTRCTFNRNSLAVSSTLTGVSADGTTLYDTARTEPGPTGGIAITAVSLGSTTHITVVDGSTLSNGEAVMLSGIVGPAALNTSALIRNLSGNTFDVAADSTGFPAYVSGGTVTPLGADSGYFDYGLITMTSGLAINRSEEIRNYVPKQFVLELPFPTPYVPVATDAYTCTPGCDKSFATCKTRFSNQLNFRAENVLPGIDKVIQVGKQK